MAVPLVAGGEAWGLHWASSITEQDRHGDTSKGYSGHSDSYHGWEQETKGQNFRIALC